MLFSHEWLQELVPNAPSPEELMERLTLHSVEVEGVDSAASHLNGIVVGRIMTIEEHPKADRLRICVVDIGTKKVRAVCGGSNIREGMLVAFATVGARVRWHGEGEPITLGPATIRGVESHGMICASDEIGLAYQFPKTEEKEIIDLSHLNGTPGAPLADALAIGGSIIDIDNKSMTHRSDLFCHWGMAREIAAVFSREAVLPELRPLPRRLKEIDVTIEDPQACRRYIGLECEVVVGPSPDFIRRRLEASGIASINNVVDITNYVMLEMGEPTHAFDADTLSGGIVVRRARNGEVLSTFSHEQKKLDDSILVIADQQKPIAIAGVIGGAETGVSNNTKRIILEVANFEPLIIRKAAQKLNARTDAAMRWEKGLPQALAEYAAQRAMALLQEYASAKLVGKIDLYPEEQTIPTIQLSVAHLQRLTGIVWEGDTIQELLKRIHCTMSVTYKKERAVYTVTPPWWRVDLKIPEDLVEEIVRLFGVNNIPEQRLAGVLEVPERDEEYEWARSMRHELSALGLFEVQNYSFYGAELMKKCGLDPDREHIEIMNPLSDDLRYLRTTVLPRMLENVAKNQFHADRLELFEIGHVYFTDREVRQLGIVVSGTADPFRTVKGIVENVLQMLHIRWTASLINTTEPCDFWNLSEGGQALRITVDAATAGTLGMVASGVRKAIGIEKPVAYAVLSVPVLAAVATTSHKIKPVSPYPAIPLDLSLIVAESVSWNAVEAIIRDRAHALLQSLEVFDVYRGDGIPKGKKSIACHLVLQSPDRTLEMKEIELWRDSLIQELSTQFGIQLREK